MQFCPKIGINYAIHIVISLSLSLSLSFLSFLDLQTENFSDKKDQLTPAAFIAMYTQVLRAVGDAEAFYTNFEVLGYNR